MIRRNHDNNMAQQCLAINKLLTLHTQTCTKVYFIERENNFFFSEDFIIICNFPYTSTVLNCISAESSLCKNVFVKRELNSNSYKAFVNKSKFI